MDLFLILTPFLLLVIVALLGFIGCTAFSGTDSSSASLSITTTSPLPDATVSLHYATSMTAVNGTPPFHWTIVGGGLPAGLTIADGGTISGIPTAAVGQYSATMQVKDSPTPPDPKTPAPSPQTAQGSFVLNVITSPTAPKVAAINPTSGPSGGGTAITVGGSNFVAGATLALGGVPASGVTVVGNTAINATTGAHGAGAVDVVVTNPDKEFATLAKGNPLVEDRQITVTGSVTPTATNSGGATSLWFMFAMGIKHA